MAVTDAYATADQYRSATGKTDASSDAEIMTDLTAISRYLDGKLERFFSQDDSDVSRIYVPTDNLAVIYTDDIVTVTSITLDTAGDDTYATALTSYDLMPFNADKGPEPRPYTRIGQRSSYFTKDVRVKVTGTFGWPAVPEAIQRATIHLTAILRIESPRATRRISELGDVMETSDDAMSIIRQLTDRYKRVSYV
jgi:hypothetical protein